MIPHLFRGHPARLRPSDLLPADQPFTPLPPVHRCWLSFRVRPLVLPAAWGVAAVVHRERPAVSPAWVRSRRLREVAGP